MHYTHDQHTAKALGIVAAICLIAITLSGCAKPVTIKQEEQSTLADTIGNMSRSGKVVACVFAPWHDECKKLKADKIPHQTQEEYIKEVNEDFDQLEQEIQNTEDK